MNYLWIDGKNSKNFQSVLPPELTEGKENICIGVCDDEDYICGAMCYRFADYQYDVLWLYVAEQRRRQGIATSLMNLLFRISASSGEIYPISARFEAAESGTLYPFFLSYRKMDLSYSHDRYVVEPRDIRGARVPRPSRKESLKQEEFLKLPELSQKKILHLLRKEENYVPEDYPEWKEQLVPELSRCILKNGTLIDLIFVHRRSDGNLELSFLYSKYPPGLAELLSTAAWDTEALFPNAKLSFDAINEDSARLADRIFPNAKKIPVYEAEW